MIIRTNPGGRCELTLYRSRAVQISMNVSVIEEWVGKMGLPRGVQSHFAPVRDLLNWLQVRNPHRDAIDLWFRPTAVSVSLIYRRLLKSDRNSADDAESESSSGKSDSVGYRRTLITRARCDVPFESTSMK